MPFPEQLQAQLDSLTQEQRDALFAMVAANAAKDLALRQAVATLRQWADDADATTATSGNAVAVLNTMLDRFAVFFDRFADLLVVLGKGDG